MPAAPATVCYCYDSDEDGEARGGDAARLTRHTGRVQLAVRARAGAATASPTAMLARSARASALEPAPASAGRIARDEAATDAARPCACSPSPACLQASHARGAGRAPVRERCRRPRGCVRHALTAVEGAVAPCVRPIGALMLDRDVFADGAADAFDVLLARACLIARWCRHGRLSTLVP
jgi:hypothetical protein